jgi:hypothetical protein
MFIGDTSRAQSIQTVIDRIRSGETRRAQEVEVERKRRYDEMLGYLTKFFSSEVQPPSELYLEGSATRELLALMREEALIYRDGHHENSEDYLLTCKGEVVRVTIMMGARETPDEVLSLDKFAEVLLAKGVTFEQALDSVRASVNALMARVDEDGAVSSVSGTLPKQTYPTIGCVVNVSGQKFAFGERMGYGLVSLNGWPYLVAFNCPQGSHECEGHTVSLTDEEMRAVEKSGIYHHVFPVFRPLT